MQAESSIIQYQKQKGKPQIGKIFLIYLVNDRYYYIDNSYKIIIIK